MKSPDINPIDQVLNSDRLKKNIAKFELLREASNKHSDSKMKPYAISTDVSTLDDTGGIVNVEIKCRTPLSRIEVIKNTISSMVDKILSMILAKLKSN